MYPITPPTNGTLPEWKKWVWEMLAAYQSKTTDPETSNLVLTNRNNSVKEAEKTLATSETLRFFEYLGKLGDAIINEMPHKNSLLEISDLDTFIAALGSDQKNGLYGPRGWTKACLLPELLAPFLAANPVATEDYYPLSGIDGETAQVLLPLLPSLALTDRQNRAPTVAEFLFTASNHPGEVFLSGYLINDQRWDERISVDTIYVLEPDPPSDWQQRGAALNNLTQQVQQCEYILEKLGWNGLTTIPDELELVRQPDWRWRPVNTLQDQKKVAYSAELPESGGATGERARGWEDPTEYATYWRLWWD